MTQKSVDLKGKKVLRSIELHPDLKPQAMKRILDELNADVMKTSNRKRITLVVYSD
jgi:hypothetical protein